MRVPSRSVYATAISCEIGASIFGTRARFTRDFITLGRVSHWGDTTRRRCELLPALRYPNVESALSTL
jgi:hypothetical protein